MVLRLIACMLFLEITSYLRETYRSLPKTRPSNPYTTLPVTSNAWERDRQSHSREGRRWSMALSSMGHSQASAQSLQSISGEKEQGTECMDTFSLSFITRYRVYVLRKRHFTLVKISLSMKITLNSLCYNTTSFKNKSSSSITEVIHLK